MTDSNNEKQGRSVRAARRPEWRFDGTPGDFVGMIKWSIVAMESEKNPEVLDILTNPEKVMEHATHRGISSEFIAREAIRLGRLYLVSDV